MNLSKPHQKYLDNYSYFPSNLHLSSKFLSASIPVTSECVVIPCKSESESIPKIITNFEQNFACPVLIILVLNQNSRCSTTYRNNCDSLQWIEKKSSASLNVFQKSPFHCTLHHISKRLKIISVDCYTQPLSSDQGVGTARKIGCDLICYLSAKGVISSLQIYSTDADVCFPPDYFDEKLDVKKDALVLKQFFHDQSELDSSWEKKAMTAYEHYLAWYPQGLKNAGSRYAFHTVGSCFVISLGAYLAVRGFPERQAGEDFHLANKLRKVGRVKMSILSPLRIMARPSDRVPFGTGSSIREISELFRKGESYDIPAEESFLALKEILAYCEKTLQMDLFDSASKSELEKIADVPMIAELSLKLESIIHRSSLVAQREKAFHDWFDGLRQHRFINQVSQHLHPKKKLYSQDFELE